MAEQPADFILPLLREIRVKQDDYANHVEGQIDGLAKQIGTLAQGQVSIRAELKTVHDEVHTMRDALHEVAIAIDGHSVRLDLMENRLEHIEQHLGLNNPKH